MKEYTLRELCKECGVTRRAVQGFEKYGLISPCGKTNRCYLLYDENAVKKAKEIKALQNYGFSLTEIKDYFASNPQAQSNVLMRKYAELKIKCSEMISFIKEIEILLNQKEN